MGALPQLVPSAVCLHCDVCCRFPERDSFLRPYFTDEEIHRAVGKGIAASYFPQPDGGQIDVVPNPAGEGCLCPAFDPTTSQCRIYDVRPLDCQIYPFVIMWNQDGSEVVLGWDSKCPFLAPQEGERLFGPLKDDAAHYAQQMINFLQSEKTLEVFARHPQLITRYQEDVVMIGPLPAVTRQVLPE